MSHDEAIIFEMGLYQAALPTRLRYADIHFWFETREIEGQARTRMGLTSYAMRLLDDVFRLEWRVTVGQQVAEAEALGEIESTKASSELYAPMSGKLYDFNTAMVEKPAQIGVDPYAHWLLEFEGRPATSLNAEEYRAFLAEGWEETQKLLKGQM
ncbi:MAG: glycine cleavage system protein H [Planctomycetota bacterium]|nr:glycine cleavage system protein H [Planctomycetota bacterium]